jgi:tripartite-type tricarboxylate transporter receptor subunit TctC
MRRFCVPKERSEKGMRIWGILFLISILFITLPQSGMTKDYPTKAITLFSPYGVGGPVDITARSLAEIAKDIFGQPVIVIDKPGGGGIIAQSIVAKEKPDGYNLAITSNIAFVQIPQMREVAFDPLKDFDFIIEHMTQVGGIVCKSDSPWKSMKELVAYSKQNPGKVTYGAPGTGGASHIGAEIIAAKEGVKWRMVPFDGSVKVVTALLGKHVDLAICDLIPWKGHVKTGELRILAIEGMGKGEDFPNATTFEELGYETTVGASFGIVAPQGTPPEIIKKLHDSFKKAIEDPRYEATCKKLGTFKTYASGEEFFKKIKKEYEVRGKILRELGLAKK